jgi:hypothetical protein
LDDVAAVVRGRGLSAKQEIVGLLVDEVAVALEILVVDVQTGRRAKKRSNLLTVITGTMVMPRESTRDIANSSRQSGRCEVSGRPEEVSARNPRELGVRLAT